MADSYSQCPKCGSSFAQPLPASAACPACGVYFFKFGQPYVPPAPQEDDTEEAAARWGIGSLLQPKPKMNEVVFYGRCLVLALLAIWSWSLFGYDYRDGEFGSSFMHNIMLPIHEAGHIFLIPFGEFMTILGGSLFQLALPLGITIAFVRINHDNFGAAIGLWWTSASLLDLAPYIYDSLKPQLILLGGHTGEDGPHDWIYLLNAVGQLKHAQGWGATAHVLGGLLMLTALAWAATVLWRQRKLLGDTLLDE